MKLYIFRNKRLYVAKETTTQRILSYIAICAKNMADTLIVELSKEEE